MLSGAAAWAVVASILTFALTSPSDRMVCWTLATALAAALACAGELSAAHQQVCFPDTHAAVLAPARPEALMVRATVRGLSMAGLLIGWTPCLSLSEGGVVLWWQVALVASSVAERGRHSLVRLCLLLLHACAQWPDVPDTFSLICAAMTPVVC